jgi:hypothetical protein
LVERATGAGEVADAVPAGEVALPADFMVRLIA